MFSQNSFFATAQTATFPFQMVQANSVIIVLQCIACVHYNKTEEDANTIILKSRYCIQVSLRDRQYGKRAEIKQGGSGNIDVVGVGL